MEDVMTEISKILMEELNRCSRDEELLDFLHYYESILLLNQTYNRK